MINVGMISIEDPPREVCLWLDDVRPMPSEYNYWCKTASEAIGVLSLVTSGVCKVVSISFDHDLGESFAGTGYDVACEIEKLACFGKLPRIQWQIHSMNPVGRNRILQAMENAEKSWDLHSIKE